MRALSFIVFFAFVFGMFMPRAANAANMPGDACASIGETKMSDDKKSIIACLVCTGETICVTGKKWKLMSTSILTIGNFMCPNDALGKPQAITSIINGVPRCAPMSTL